MKKWQIFDDVNHSMTTQKTQGALESCKIETVQHTVIFFHIKSFWRKHMTEIHIWNIVYPTHLNFNQIFFDFCLNRYDGILLPKQFWVLTFCKKKLLKFEVEDRELAKCLRSLEQIIQTEKGYNNFWNRLLF